MKASSVFAAALVVTAWLQSLAAAADPVSPPEQAIQAAAGEGQLLFLLFHREVDAASDAAFEEIKAVTTSHAGAAWAACGINDPVHRAVAERFGVARGPMPLVLALHPNGAVTGVFHTRFTREALAKCLVSPRKADCMKGLQENQLVLIQLQTQPGQPLSNAAREWISDPHYGPRTRVVSLYAADPAEAAFLAEMQIAPQTAEPLMVLLAPPGVLVGKFTSAAGKQHMAAKLAESGKCCEDENCKHNQQSTKGAAKSGKVSR